jgi:hypothetical protein
VPTVGVVIETVVLVKVVEKWVSIVITGYSKKK